MLYLLSLSLSLSLSLAHTHTHTGGGAGVSLFCRRQYDQHQFAATTAGVSDLAPLQQIPVNATCHQGTRRQFEACFHSLYHPHRCHFHLRHHRQKFSNVLCITVFGSKYTRALTFQDFCKVSISTAFTTQSASKPLCWAGSRCLASPRATRGQQRPS